MTPPLEHDYIGLAETSAMENSTKISSSSSSSSSTVSNSEDNGKLIGHLNLKETELRLGLPGSEFPERGEGVGLTLGLPKSFGSGAKRGFSDAIDGSAKWVFSGGGGSEVGLGKGGILFSPRGENGSGKLPVASPAKDLGGVGKATGQENKGKVGSGLAAPAAKAQVVGWPPIRSYRKNTMASNSSKNKEDDEGKQEVGCLYIKVSMDGAPYLRKVDLKTYSNYKELSLALEKMFSCFIIGQCSSNEVSSRERISESRMIDTLQGSEYVLTYEDKDGDWMLVGDVPWDMFIISCQKLRIMKGSDATGNAPRALE
ncbi:auxin-responsive protein IAA19-like [Typha latifolia]|uniref:auxin-responsive protein IAA19-like n=1 Tax=Typha latifolia TaxID=4733 RepID=UPI003C2AC6CD